MATKCGDSYYGVFRKDAIYEFKDVTISVDAERLTEADRLNGIEWRGTASFNPRLYRERSSRGEWSPWRDGGGPAFYSLQTLGIAIWMLKQNGQWSIQHSGQPFLFGSLEKIECFEVPGLSSVPPFTLEVARDLAKAAIPDKYHPGVTFAAMANIPVNDGLTGKPLLENTQKVEQILDLLRKYGVGTVNPHVSSGYYGVDQFSAPAAWNKYCLASTWLSAGQTPIPRFRLSEAINFEVESVKREGESTVSATLHIRHEGCSPICELANDLRGLGPRSWESRSGVSTRAGAGTTRVDNDSYWGELVFRGDQEGWPFKNDWPREQRIQVYYAWNLSTHAWEVTRVGDASLVVEAAQGKSSQQTANHPLETQTEERPSLKRRKEEQPSQQGGNTPVTGTAASEVKPVRASDLIRIGDTTQPRQSGDSTQSTQEVPPPCDSTRPDIVLLPNQKAQVELKPDCWSPWINISDTGWKFNTIGASHLVEILFKDGYRHLFRSKDDDFQIDPNRVRVFCVRGTGRVEIIAH